MPIIQPGVERFVTSPIAQEFISAFEGLLPTAWVIGGAYNRGSNKIPLAVGGVSIERLQSLSNKKIAWYVAPKLGVGSQGAASSLSVFGGLVWGVNRSEDYEGGFVTVSAGYRRLPRSVQRVVDRVLREVGTEMITHVAGRDIGKTPLETRNINAKIEEFKRQIANNSSNELLVNISVGRAGSGSITLSYDFTFNATRKRSWAVQGSLYSQIWPWDDNVPFK